MHQAIGKLQKRASAMILDAVALLGDDLGSELGHVGRVDIYRDADEGGLDRLLGARVLHLLAHLARVGDPEETHTASGHRGLSKAACYRGSRDDAQTVRSPADEDDLV